MRDADIGCSLGASDALTTARLQGDPAAAALLLQLQEYIHSQGFNLLLVIQLLTIIGLVALAIWVRENIANIRNKDMDAEHPTTCFELLRQGRVVIAGLESEVARLQVQVRDLNDNLKLEQQDGGHRTTRREELLRRQKPAKAAPQALCTSSAAHSREDGRALSQDALEAFAVLASSNSSNAHHPVAHAAHGQDGGSSPAPITATIDCLHLAAEAEAHDSDLAAAGSQFRATARSSVEGGTSTEHALKKSKSFENMVAIFGTPPLTMISPLAAPYVDQARVTQSRTTSLGHTDPNGAAPARAGATRTFEQVMSSRLMMTPDAPPTPLSTAQTETRVRAPPGSASGPPRDHGALHRVFDATCDTCDTRQALHTGTRRRSSRPEVLCAGSLEALSEA